MTKREQLEHCKKWLRKNFPSEYQVRVYLSKPQLLKGDKGLTSWVSGEWQFEGRFVIRIADNLNQDETIGVLLHEWGHVLRDHAPRDAHYDHHDEIHSVYAGRIWRIWTEELRSDI